MVRPHCDSHGLLAFLLKGAPMINWRRTLKIPTIFFFMLCAFLGGKNAFAINWTTSYTAGNTYYVTPEAYTAICQSHPWYAGYFTKQNGGCSFSGSNPQYPNSSHLSGNNNLECSIAARDNNQYDCSDVPQWYKDEFPETPDPATCTASSLSFKMSEDDTVNITGNNTITTSDGCQYELGNDPSCYVGSDSATYCTISSTPTGTTTTPPQCTETSCEYTGALPPSFDATCPMTDPQRSIVNDIVNNHQGTVTGCGAGGDVNVTYWNTNINCVRQVSVSPDGNWFEFSPLTSPCNGSEVSEGDYADPNTNPDADIDYSDGSGTGSGGPSGSGGSYDSGPNGDPLSGGHNTDGGTANGDPADYTGTDPTGDADGDGVENDKDGDSSGECGILPDIICDFFDDFTGMDDPAVPFVELDEYEEYSSGVTTGTCPPPMTFTVTVPITHTFTWSYEPLCEFSADLKPLILLSAYLASGFILFGAVRV